MVTAGSSAFEDSGASTDDFERKSFLTVVKAGNQRHYVTLCPTMWNKSKELDHQPWSGDKWLPELSLGDRVSEWGASRDLSCSSHRSRIPGTSQWEVR
jgi:hypothetical protein